MENASIHRKLHDYIDSVDEQKLQAMYVIFQPDMEHGDIYDDDTLAALHQRRERHLKGSQSYEVADTLAFARSQRK